MKPNYLVVALVLVTFFMVSFFTNILGPLFPELIKSFDIGLTLAGLFPFAFFIAYGVMSIPAGLLVQRFGEKRVMLGAFTLAGLGALLFAVAPLFLVAMLALFLIGTAMAMLQVAINPLLRRSGGSAHFAAFSVLAQLLFGAAASVSPWVYVTLASQIQAYPADFTWIPAAMPWLSMYWLFALLSVLMLIWIGVSKFATVERNDEEILSWRACVGYFRHPTVIRFFFAIVAYVALEQGIANSIAVFLQTYHQIEPQYSAQVISQFWLMLTLGCVLGLLLLKLFDAKLILMLFCLGASLSLIAALIGNTDVALMAFPLSGFFLSVMWSVLFSLALNSVPSGHGAISGVLCTGIIGGALASPVIGILTQLSGSLQLACLVLLLPLAYIAWIARWAQPIVRNHTIRIFRRRQTELTEKQEVAGQ
ncbi:MFS transporter [Pseudoalteromonas sp. OOF1S-7]|uniref:MFS transporter n=1 Tax=Pseudoalteromonas sp. OOF1S-7 TaxID=2917757 RepID=UPI001EF71D64|nr:MFS transporter [Pseudoalteromonas sp. OOF1S-7]MCG7537261.1 MFS transporter [Pseudoalteromonas sp. OOF1S-7]